MSLTVNGQTYDSYLEAYKTGSYDFADIEGELHYCDLAEEYYIEFPDGTWIWQFERH